MNNNFGKPVSHQRIDAAEAALKQMLPGVDPLTRLEILGFFKNRVERDQPAALLCSRPPKQIEALDLTGRYRLLATMVGR